MSPFGYSALAEQPTKDEPPFTFVEKETLTLPALAQRRGSSDAMRFVSSTAPPVNAP